MKAFNSFALLSLYSLAAAGIVQADEPIKAQAQQQPTNQAQTPQYQWVQSGRRNRWVLVNPSQDKIVQSPASPQHTPPSSAASPSANSTASPAKITAVSQPPVVEQRRQGLLSRLRGKRTYYYSSVPSGTPVISALSSGAAQPLPNPK